MFYAPSQDAQRPTHHRLHVRDARDAQTVFEAVRRGILKPVSRRLNEIERSMFIQSGSIFVWEESDDELGLKRWTDGRVWSQSRMREPYLFYDEKLPNDPSSNSDAQGSRSQAVFRFVDGTTRGNQTSSILSHFDRSAHRPLGLVKQAYSAYVVTSPGTKPRKWHLTAYFTYADLQNLPIIDNDPTLRSVTVPHGVYRSGKARSRNSDLSVDTSSQMPSSSIGSSLSSSPPSTPRIMGTPSSSNASQGPIYQDFSSSHALPPLHTAVDRMTSLPVLTSPQREARWSEDQRVIQMLNSRHIR
ncbi:Gti1/Pac2 family-domain-containing protein [Phellopilus nigrolimitatus]|nr:Gti1/Pac2 family-domain-containing protein [Phellopilus nigrolimitatus]